MRRMSDATTICRTCELLQRLPLGAARRHRCGRCGAMLPTAIDLVSRRRSVLACTLAALVLYPLAIGLPVMRVEQLGHSHEAGILGGGIDLIAGGDFTLGVLVIACSVVLPLVKLLGLLALASTVRLPPRLTGRVLRFVEGTGRWGMLDVLLVAILAALIKLGDLVAIKAGIGATTFVLCVGLSLVASGLFDPRIVFGSNGDESRECTDSPACTSSSHPRGSHPRVLPPSGLHPSGMDATAEAGEAQRE